MKVRAANKIAISAIESSSSLLSTISRSLANLIVKSGHKIASDTCSAQQKLASCFACSLPCYYQLFVPHFCPAVTGKPSINCTKKTLNSDRFKVKTIAGAVHCFYNKQCNQA